MRTINYIVVHCSATREDRPFTVEALRAAHLSRGFSDIGYHYYIRRDGTVEKTRPLALVGAHVKGYNKYSIGCSGLPEGHPYAGTACCLAIAGTSTVASFPWRSARLRSSRSQSGQEWRRGGGAGGVGEGMPVLRSGYGIVINLKACRICKPQAL